MPSSVEHDIKGFFAHVVAARYDEIDPTMAIAITMQGLFPPVMEQSALQVLTSKLQLGFDRTHFQMPCVSYKANPGIAITIAQENGARSTSLGEARRPAV